MIVGIAAFEEGLWSRIADSWMIHSKYLVSAIAGGHGVHVVYLLSRIKIKTALIWLVLATFAAVVFLYNSFERLEVFLVFFECV